jgi:superfamily II DNA or RNA helicase
MKLRGRQSEVVQAVLAAAKVDGSRFLVVASTGFGKTIIANAITKALPQRIAFIVPRIQLIEQTRGKFERESTVYCAS